jgi:hypothetical protein
MLGNDQITSPHFSRSCCSSPHAADVRAPLDIRLTDSLKPDWACALQRKTAENVPAAFDGTLSPVRFKGKTCRIAAIFNDFCGKQPYFSATQTVWRSEVNSNPRYQFPACL